MDKEKEVFSVFVDYNLSLKEMVDLGHYDCFDDAILEHEIIEGKPEGKGQQEVQLELVHFNESLSTETVLNKLDEMGYRPATLVELLAFGAKYPEKQKEFSIVALGSVFNGPCSRVVAYLGYMEDPGYWLGYDPGRDLHLYHLTDIQGGGWRFLIVRK